jgi:alcohol dehydrogenase class IV
MNPALQIFFPGKLVFGNGCFVQLTDAVLQMQVKKLLVVTIPQMLETIAPAIASWEKNGIQTKTDTSINREPSIADFEKLMQIAQPFNPDLVIGIGGGSVLDIAKLVAAQTGNEQPLQHYIGIGLLNRRSKKLICVPTTSGTGSEVSPNAILVDDADQQKKGIISPFLVPDLVFTDPLLTVSLPKEITAATGIDALTHCMEAYTNKFAQPFIDLFAVKGMELIAAHIVEAVQNGTDIHAREQVAMGSLLGGFCLGPVNTAGVHALSYPLGSTFHLPHGLSNALLLPFVMEFNLVAEPKRYAEVAVALGCTRTSDDHTTALQGVEKIKLLIKDCGLPPNLTAVGVSQSVLPELAAAAIKIKRLLNNNPREITETDALAIYKAAL